MDSIPNAIALGWTGSMHSDPRLTPGATFFCPLCGLAAALMIDARKALKSRRSGLKRGLFAPEGRTENSPGWSIAEPWE